jgi:hypothetical protein
MNVLLVPIVVGEVIINLILGGYILWKKPGDLVRKYFLLYIIAVTFWQSVTMVALHFNSLIIVRFVLVTANIMLMSLLLLSYVFTYGHIKKRLLICILFITFCGIGLTLSPYVFKDIVVHDFKNETIPGIAIIPYSISVIIIQLSCFYLFLKSLLQNCDSLKRMQAFFMMVGLVVINFIYYFFGFILTTTLSTTRYVPIAVLSPIIFIAITAYAITRYRLFDIKIVLRNTVLRSFIYVGMIVVAFSMSFLITLMVGGTMYQLLVIALPFTLVAQFFGTYIFDRYFSTKGTTGLSVLPPFTVKSQTESLFKEFTDHLDKTLRQDLLLTDYTFCVYDHVEQYYRSLESAPVIQLNKEHNVFAQLQTHPVLFYDTVTQSDIKRLFKKYNSQVVVALTANNFIYGLIFITDASNVSPAQLDKISKQFGQHLSQIMNYNALV